MIPVFFSSARIILLECHESPDLQTGFQALSPNYDMDAYMAALNGGEAWDLCCELGQAKS